MCWRKERVVKEILRVRKWERRKKKRKKHTDYTCHRIINCFAITSSDRLFSVLKYMRILSKVALYTCMNISQLVSFVKLYRQLCKCKVLTRNNSHFLKQLFDKKNILREYIYYIEGNVYVFHTASAAFKTFSDMNTV